MNLNEVQPQEILEQVFIADYHEKMNLLQDEVVIVNSNLFILREMSGFRFDLFVAPCEQTLPAIVWLNLERMAAVGICKLATDRDGRTLTLNWMANEVRSHALSQYQAAVDAHLAKHALDAATTSLLDRIKELRDRRVAHLDRDFNLAMWMKASQLTLNDITSACAVVTRFFGALGFGHGRGHLPLDYLAEPGSGSDGRTDIRKLLDGIARSSPLLNMPERQPEYWELHWRESLAKADIALINRYRREARLDERVPREVE